jgi:hypothetical protein
MCAETASKFSRRYSTKPFWTPSAPSWISEQSNFAVDQALQRLRSGDAGQLDRQTAIERGLSLIEARSRHLVEAIARGEPPDTLLSQLREEETRKKALIYDLGGLVRGIT